MLAPIGTWLRDYREKERITLRDMARRIGVSAAYLSAVETGRKKPAARLAEMIREEYQLGPNQYKELSDASIRSEVSVKIDFTSSHKSSDREIAALFARNFDSLTPDKMQQIRDILEGLKK
jgi:transcriptional regulator with XRE-family HTH domain